MNGGADDKRQRRIFAAFTAVTVFAALFTAAALGLIVSPLITKAYAYAVYALSAAFLLAAAGIYNDDTRRVRAQKGGKSGKNRIKRRYLTRFSLL